MLGRCVSRRGRVRPNGQRKKNTPARRGRRSSGSGSGSSSAAPRRRHRPTPIEGRRRGNGKTTGRQRRRRPRASARRAARPVVSVRTPPRAQCRGVPAVRCRRRRSIVPAITRRARLRVRPLCSTRVYFAFEGPNRRHRRQSNDYNVMSSSSTTDRCRLIPYAAAEHGRRPPT